MASKLMTSAEKRGYEEGLGELDDAMAEILGSIYIPSSNSSKQRRIQETANYKNELASMAKTMAEMKGQVGQQNDSNPIQLKKDADLINLFEAAEAKVAAVRSKPNPTPTQKIYLEVVENTSEKYLNRFREVPILSKISDPMLSFTRHNHSHILIEFDIKDFSLLRGFDARHTEASVESGMALDCSRRRFERGRVAVAGDEAGRSGRGT